MPGRDRAGRARAPRGARRRRRDVRDARATRCSTRSHERFDFWTWGGAGCCLPRGATVGDAASATIPQLKAGDVLVLAEVAGPVTGRPEDADPAKRAAVRLTSVVPSRRPVGRALRRPADERRGRGHRDRVGRGRRAAVPALHLGRGASRTSSSARRGATSCSPTTGGRSRPSPRRGAAAGARPRSSREGCDPCEHDEPEPVPIRFRPTLANAPVTQARPAPTREVARGPADAGARRRPRRAHVQPGSCTTSSTSAASRSAPAPRSCAAATTRGRSATASPSRCCASTAGHSSRTRARRPRPRRSPPTRARPGRRSRSRARCSARPSRGRRRPTCSARDGDAPEFVVEVETDGAATLRFGDGDARPPARDGHRVHGDLPRRQRRRGQRRRAARSRTSSTLNGAIVGATNPLPAAGGTDPETADAVRRDAPEAYLVQERAVTADDYASVSERDPHVQRAAATFRWTGSWHTVFVTADRVGGAAVDDAVRDRASRDYLEPFRMAGYDLEVDGPRFVAARGRAARLRASRTTSARTCRPRVLDVLSSRVRADGTLGFFHPDRFTFGAARLPVRDRRRRAGRRGRPVGDAARRSSASATTPRARSTPACCRWAGSRSRGSTTTRASPSTACSS